MLGQIEQLAEPDVGLNVVDAQAAHALPSEPAKPGKHLQKDGANARLVTFVSLFAGHAEHEAGLPKPCL